MRIGAQYDEIGRLTALTYPDGRSVHYTYGRDGQLYSIPGYLTSLVHNAAGQPLSAGYANGTAGGWSYDPRRLWLDSQTLERGFHPLYDAAYHYAPTGLVTSTSSSTNRMNATYTYTSGAPEELATVTGDDAETLSRTTHKGTSPTTVSLDAIRMDPVHATEGPMPSPAPAHTPSNTTVLES